MAMDFKVMLQAVADLSKLQSQINKESKNIRLKLGVDTTDIQKQINNITKTQKDALSNFYSSNSKGSSGYIKTYEKLLNQQDLMTDKLDIVKTRAEGASAGFNSYVKSLKPQALKDYSNRINEVSNSFSKAAQSGKSIDLSKANAQLSRFKGEMKDAGMESLSLSKAIKDNIGAFTNWYLIGGAVSSLIGNFKEAIVVINEVDTLLTEISKTSDLSGESLKNLGSDAFDAASKYGTTVQSYLSGYLEMSRGTDEKTAKGLAGLSILAQSAGDMTAELANGYIVATNAAYKYNNDVSKLTEVLDGQNQITNRNQVSMTDLADATKVAGSQASQAGVEIDKMTAATGTMIATTKQGGEIAGRAYKAILMNLQQVSGETEDGEVLNEDSFKKAEKALNEVGVATEELVDGTAKLRDPMQILKELSDVYNSLPNDSAQKANIISGLGGKHYGNQLAALLSNWETYDKMLSDYQNSTGSAANEAEKTANSLQGRINEFTNTWDRMVSNVVDSDILKTFVSVGTGAVDLADNMNLLQTAMIGMGLFGALKGGTALLSWLNNAVSSTMALGNAMNAVKVIDSVDDWMSLSNAVKGLSVSQAQTVISTKAFSVATVEAAMARAGFTTEEIAVTTATMALSTATGTATTATWSLSSAFSGLSAIIAANPIGAAITAITVVASLGSLAFNKYKQSQEEAMESAKQASSEAVTLTDDISTLSLKYKELSSAVKSDESVKGDFLSTQNELLKALGIESSQIDSLVEKYGSLDNAINQVTLDSLKSAQGDLISGIGAYRDELLDAGSSDMFGNNDLFIGELGEYEDLINKLKDANISGTSIKSSDNGLFYMDLLGDDSTVDGILQNYDALTQAQELLKKEYSTEELSNNDFFIDLTNQIDTLKKSVDNYNTAISDLNNNSAQSSIIENLMGKDLPKSQEEFESFKKSLIDSASASDDFIGSQQDISDSITNALASMPEFSQFFNNISQAEGNAGNKIKDAFDFETNSEGIDDYQSKLSDLATALSSLNDGSFSDSDMVDLLQEFPQLEGETDNLSEAIKKLVQDNLTTLLTTLGEDAPPELINSLQAMADKATEVTTNVDTMAGAISSIKGVSDAMGVLDDTFAETIDNEGKIDYSNLEKLQSTFGNLNLPSFDNFISTLTNSASTAEETQQAFSTLTDEYIRQSGILDNLSFTTADFIAQQLQEMGISNAQEVVYSALGVSAEEYAKVKQFLTQTGVDLTNMTYQEIQALVQESGMSQNAAQAIYVFALKKQIANGITLNTSGDIQNLMSLVSAIGGATNALSTLNAVKSGGKPVYGVGGAEGYASMVKSAQEEVNVSLQQVENANQKVASSAQTINYTGGANSAKALADNAKDAEKAAKEAKTAAEELADAISELESNYDQMLTLLTDRADKLNNVVKLIETKGELVSPKLYKELTKESNKEMSLLNKKISEYQSMLDQGLADGTINKFDDNWYKLTQGIEDTKDEILNCSIEIEEFQNKINELKWERFELFTDQIDNTTKEIDGLLDLLDNKKLVNDDGSWTSEGITSLALLAEKYEANTYKAQQYAEAIESLEKDYRAGKYSTTEYMKKLAELKSAQSEAVNTAEEEKQAIVDLNEQRVEAAKDAIQKETDAYEKLIEAKKKALEADEDAYQFAKKVNEEQADIDTIQSKIDALSGDTTASGMAKRNKLQADLADAQSTLDDTNHDNTYDSTMDALDVELNKYKETKQAEIDALETSLANQDAIVTQSLALVQANYTTVYATLTGLADEYNLDVSASITQPWTDGSNAIAQYGETLSNSTSAFVEQLGSVKQAIADIAAEADRTASSLMSMYASKDVGTAETPETAGSGSSSSSGKSSGGSGSSKTTITKHYKIVETRTGTALKSGFNSEEEAQEYADSHNYASNRVSIKEYAKGTRNATGGFANVDEKGLELILGKASEGRWRVMNDGDQVLTSSQTDNIYDWAKFNPSNFTNLLPSSLTSTSTPNLVTNSTSSSNNVTIENLVTIQGNVDDSNLAKITSVVKNEISNTFKNLNYSIKKGK